MSSTAELQIQQTIASVTARRLGDGNAAFDPTAPFDLLGLDSLATIELTADLEHALGYALPDDLLVDCQDGRQLASRIARFTRDSGAQRADPFEQMLADAVLPGDIRPDCPGPQRSTALQESSHILLTGATGFLGSRLVAELLTASRARISCLVRPGGIDLTARLLCVLQAAGADLRQQGHRVTAVPADLERPRLGLDAEDWTRLASDVDAVCHAGAAVNWIFSYAALRAANVMGTVELLRFAAPRALPFHFVSSVSACYSIHGPRVADESFDGFAHVRGVQLGYAQTKVIAEALVREAGARGVPTRIYRPALISGDSRTGRFNGDDLITTLVRGCVHMGTAPDLDWKLDSIPLDFAARAIVALSGDRNQTHHLLHERPRHWRECVLWMRMYGYPLRLVPYHAWLRQLQEETVGAQANSSHPLRALRSFFLDRQPAAGGLTLPEIYEEKRRTLATGDVTRQRLNGDLRCAPLDASLLDTYFTAFREQGVLPAPLPTTCRSRCTPRQADGLTANLVADLLQCDVVHVEVLDRGSDHSIVSELTAWRSGRSTGLFTVAVTLTDGSRRTVRVKSKCHDSDVTAVGSALAGLVDPAVGSAYARFSHRIGFDQSHRREVEIYRQTDRRFVAHAPELLGSISDDRSQTWMLALEDVTQASVMDTSAVAHTWTRREIDTVLDGLAALHSIWWGRETELLATDWIGHVPSTDSMTEMSDLWNALARQAAPAFSSWADPNIAAVQRRLIDTIPQWWQHLEAAPRTLIHHDFNPRNLCIRSERLCAFDWELATIGAPQRDLAEFLCFVLPADVDASASQRWVDVYRTTLEEATGQCIDPAGWQRGWHAALYDVMVNRLTTYALVNRIRRQPFLPRVVQTWSRLYEHFPLEACV